MIVGALIFTYGFLQIRSMEREEDKDKEKGEEKQNKKEENKKKEKLGSSTEVSRGCRLHAA